ncbi:hypothetical protein [Bacillus pumilus]|uniref:hypothetical protein n=1 Tax=Bacillus pumilus TaxID=1408 RepID=UPI001C21AB97|nr:hypothetical protein [Bacillus pumilus]MBU8607887.1 hypothetical protein [Bacillus pumilus]
MNGREQAEEKIIDFLKSDERVAIVTGTHMHQKIDLVMNVLCEHLFSENILFRTYTLENASRFLKSSTKLKTGVAYRGGLNNIYVDTLKERTWGKHGDPIHTAVIYPLKPMSAEKLRTEAISNLLDRVKVKKLILVSNQDALDLTWAASINTKIVYDSLEDDPEYHQRVIDDIASKGFKRL